MPYNASGKRYKSFTQAFAKERPMKEGSKDGMKKDGAMKDGLKLGKEYEHLVDKKEEPMHEAHVHLSHIHPEAIHSAKSVHIYKGKDGGVSTHTHDHESGEHSAEEHPDVSSALEMAANHLDEGQGKDLDREGREDEGREGNLNQSYSEPSYASVGIPGELS